MSISFSAFKQRVVKRPDSPSAVLNVTDLPTTCVLRGALARASTVSFNRLVRGPVITALRTLRRGEELPPELSELRRHFERGLTYKNAAKVSALGLYLIARGDRNRFSRCLAVAGLINGLNSQHSADFSAAALVALAFGQEDPWVISQVESRLLNPRKPQGSAALALQLAKYVHRTAEQGRESKLAARLLEAVLEICEENTASGLYCVGYLPAVAIAHCMPRYSEASTRVLFKSLGERDTAYHAAAAIFRMDVSRQASEGEAAQLICASLRELNRINKLEVLAACSENIDRPIARLVSERQKVNFVELFSVPEAIPSVCKIIDALSDSSLQDGDLIEVVNRALVRVESIARLVHCLPQLSCADPDTLSRYVADTALEKVLRYYHFLEPTSYINTLNVSLDIFTEASETLTACTQIFLDRKKYDRASQYLNPIERLLEYWGLESHDFLYLDKSTSALSGSWTTNGSTQDLAGVVAENLRAMVLLERERPGSVSVLAAAPYNIRLFFRYPHEALLQQYDDHQLDCPQSASYLVWQNPVGDYNFAFRSHRMRIFKLAFNKLRSNGDQLKFIESHSPEQLLRQGMQLCRMFGPIQNGILSGHGPQLDLGGKNDSCITPQMLRDKKIRRRINRILSEDVLLSVVACRSGDLNAGLARSLSEMSKVAAVHASDANVSRWQLESFESSAKAKHLIRFIGAPTRIFRGGDMVALSDPHTLHEAVSA